MKEIVTMMTTVLTIFFAELTTASIFLHLTTLLQNMTVALIHYLVMALKLRHGTVVQVLTIFVEKMKEIVTQMLNVLVTLFVELTIV
jgi:hypothetical protein